MNLPVCRLSIVRAYDGEQAPEMGGSAGAADRRFVFYMWTADANAKLLANTVTGYIKLWNT